MTNVIANQQTLSIPASNLGYYQYTFKFVATSTAGKSYPSSVNIITTKDTTFPLLSVVPKSTFHCD